MATITTVITSTLWAGPEKIDLGLPTPHESAFRLDPEIKRECIWAGIKFRPASMLVDRRGPVVSVRKENGEWSVANSHVPTFDSMLTRIADPQRAPEVLTIRETIRAWRFYDHFRVDAEAPIRSPLRFLLWSAALLTPRPPPLMVLNEPETSLHPDLLPALARLILEASKSSQLWIVSHSARLIAALEDSGSCNSLRLAKDMGETQIVGQELIETPSWQWPAR